MENSDKFMSNYVIVKWVCICDGFSEHFKMQITSSIIDMTRYFLMGKQNTYYNLSSVGCLDSCKTHLVNGNKSIDSREVPLM